MSFADHQDYRPEPVSGGSDPLDPCEGHPIYPTVAGATADPKPREVEMTDAPIYPHTIQDGEIGRLRLACNACGKSVSSPFYPVMLDPPDTGLVVRAWIECPECLEKRKQP